jgi:hypothetical protein
MGVKVYICGHLQSLQLRANRSLLRRKKPGDEPGSYFVRHHFQVAVISFRKRPCKCQSLI